MFKSLTKFDYLLRETWLGLRRGGWMNWAAISTVTVLLFLFGLCLQTSWQIDSLLNNFGSQVEVSVYLEPEVEGEEILSLVTKLPQVKSATMISREQAWESLLTDMGVTELEQVTNQLEGNPLVDELKVNVTNAELIPIVANSLTELPGVDEVVYINEALERIKQLREGINWVSITLTILLSLTSMVVIMSTLRLIAIARKREIEIMQLVGATSIWIYLPFVFQGISFGLIGGVIAWILMISFSHSLNSFFLTQSDFIQFITEGLQLNLTQTLLLPVMVFSLGTTVGLTGSLFALRRLKKFEILD